MERLLLSTCKKISPPWLLSMWLMTFDPDFLGCSSSTDRPFELVNNDINERSNEGGESDERSRSPLTVEKEVSQT